MDCIEAKSHVDEYIKRTLPERKQEEFIRHVRACPNCFAELETYFIVDVALGYFESKKVETYDIRNLLQEDLDKRFKRRQHKKFMIIVLMVLSVVFVALVIVLLRRW